MGSLLLFRPAGSVGLSHQQFPFSVGPTIRVRFPAREPRGGGHRTHTLPSPPPAFSDRVNKRSGSMLFSRLWGLGPTGCQSAWGTECLHSACWHLVDNVPTSTFHDAHHGAAAGPLGIRVLRLETQPLPGCALSSSCGLFLCPESHFQGAGTAFLVAGFLGPLCGAAGASVHRGGGACSEP